MPKPRHRRPKISLKLVLVLVAFTCVWFAFERSRASKQAQAIEQVRRCGGHFKLAERFDEEAISANPLSAVPAWLRWQNDAYFKRVHEIDFDSFLRDGSPSITNDVLRRVCRPDLRGLYLSNNQSVSDDGLKHLKGLKDLTVLTLSHTGVDGSGLRHLVGCRLEGLDLGHTSVTDIALEHVGRLSNLEWLLLNDTDISDSGASKLVGIDSLRILAVNDTQISDESLRVFSRFEKLEWLSLLRTSVSKTGVLELQASLPNCRIVWRDEQRTVLDKIRSLDGRIGLKRNDALLPEKIPDDIREIFADVIRITVRSQDFVDEDIKRLETFSELKHLNIAATAVSENGLQELLGQSTKLEYVTLANNPRITDSSLMVLQNLPNLKSLSIANTRISDSGLAMLREVENLEVLHINSQLITDEGIEHLGSVEALKELSLDFSKGIEGLKFESLSKLKRLEELSLSNTRIDDRSIGGLSKLKQLRFLSVGGTDISTSGLAAIRAKLPSTRVMHWAKSDPVKNATAEP